MKKIGILGRTNVGKSTLFNRLIKQGKAITSPVSGTTRDFIASELNLKGNAVRLLDFGGLDFSTQEVIEKDVQKGILRNLDSLDLVLFVVDGKCALSAQDIRTAELLRKEKKSTIVVVNKIEKEKDKECLYDFYSLGFDEVVGISAKANKNLDELIGSMLKALRLSKGPKIKKDETSVARIAIIGKPNVGKSSLFNYLYGEERSIVTPIAGTTRDSIDEKVKIGADEYVFIDTAGLKRKTKINEGLEKESSYRSINAIDRSNLIIYVLDVSSYVVGYDIKLINYAWKKGKSILVVVNKWDIKSADMTEKKYQDLVSLDYSIFKKFPFVFVSAVTGYGVGKALEEIKRLATISSTSIKTSKLNNEIKKIVSEMGYIGMKVFYAVQTGVSPIEITLFINNAKHFKKKYVEFIESRLRSKFNLSGVPIDINLRERER